MLWATFPPWDAVARQLNDLKFSHTRGFNLGKGQVELEMEREEERRKLEYHSLFSETDLSENDIKSLIE